MEQLLWAETLLKGTIGICLLMAPKIIVRLFSLPDTISAFWPRLTGSILLGLALVIFMSGAKIIDDGIGLGGLAVLNYCAAAVLISSRWGSSSPTGQRGGTLLAYLAIGLCLLATAELVAR